MRFAAFIIDNIILYLLIYLPIRIAFSGTFPRGNFHNWRRVFSETLSRQPLSTDLICIGFALAVVFGYGALLESCSWQGTVGKRALGLKVTDLDGARITFLHALGRNVAKWLPVLVCCACYIGWIMAAFTARKQTLHDKLAETLVFWK